MDQIVRIRIKAFSLDSTSVLDSGMIRVVPPKSNRLHAWDYDRALQEAQ